MAVKTVLSPGLNTAVSTRTSWVSLLGISCTLSRSTSLGAAIPGSCACEAVAHKAPQQLDKAATQNASDVL